MKSLSLSLPGDSSRFHTEGKYECRVNWDRHSSSLFEQKYRKLNYLWLANNDLSDIDAILPTVNSITIPEKDPMSHAAKRRTLVNKYGLRKRNDFIRVCNSFDRAVYGYTIFDIINLDTCSFLNLRVLFQIELLLKNRMSSHSYLFLTFAKSGMGSLWANRIPDYNRIASTREEIDEILNISFKRFKYKAKELSGFPLTYKSNADRPTQMYSFGWELNRA